MAASHRLAPHGFAAPSQSTRGCRRLPADCVGQSEAVCVGLATNFSSRRLGYTRQLVRPIFRTLGSLSQLQLATCDGNARLTFRGREILVSRSWNKACASRTLHRLPESAGARHTSGSRGLAKAVRRGCSIDHRIRILAPADGAWHTSADCRVKTLPLNLSADQPGARGLSEHSRTHLEPSWSQLPASVGPPHAVEIPYTPISHAHPPYL